MKNKDYSKIIKKIMEGDTASFEIIMRKFNPYLHKIGRTYGFNHEDTQDLMQETYMNVYQGLSSFENRSTLKSWITKIMLNNCYHKSSRLDKEQDYLKMATALNKESNSSNLVFNAELSNVLEKSLEQLPMDYRMVFILREKNGLKISETAEALDISQANVKVRLNRAKKKLKELIAKQYTKEDIYEFQVVYCDKMVNRVFLNINTLISNQLN